MPDLRKRSVQQPRQVGKSSHPEAALREKTCEKFAITLQDRLSDPYRVDGLGRQETSSGMEQSKETGKVSKRKRRRSDRSDMRIVLIPRAYWFAASCLFLLFAVVCYWALFGAIPIKASGSGMIEPTGRQFILVESRLQGRISNLQVAPGDEVAVKQPLAEVDGFDPDNRIASLATALREEVSALDALRQRLEFDVAGHEAAFEALHSSYVGSIARLEKNRHDLAEGLSGIDSQPSGPASGVVHSRTQLYRDTLSQLADLRTQLAEALQTLSDFNATASKQIASTDSLLASLRRTLRQLEASRLAERTVLAPVAGRVEELRVVQGQSVAPGTTILTMTRGGAGFEMLAFLPATDAGRVAVGMPAHIRPASVNKAEYGTIRGRVSVVSANPISKAGAMTLFQDEELAARFTSGGETYLTRIELEADLDSPSGFKWWAGDGPPFPIEAGIPADVEIVLEELPPVTLIVPAARRLTRS